MATIIDIPTERPWCMADEGYPVDGDKLAAHLDDPGHGKVRRFEIGDLLWPMVAGS